MSAAGRGAVVRGSWCNISPQILKFASAIKPSSPFQEGSTRRCTGNRAWGIPPGAPTDVSCIPWNRW